MAREAAQPKVRVRVQPGVLRWALERAGLDEDQATEKFPKLPEWISGDAEPTLKQLEKFAGTLHVPIGFMFLPEPPDEQVPIPDLRTVANRRVARPSANLLDTVHLCQLRQDWYREFARQHGQEPLAFVGSANVGADVEQTAATMRHFLGLDIEERSRFTTWEEALRSFIERAEAVGIMVLVSGVAGGNTHRALRTEEFRGFALSDDIAPLVFINGADSKSAQMFTLAHELAHVWAGKSALSDLGVAIGGSEAPKDGVEDWCNRVAAELLVPRAMLTRMFKRSADLRLEAQRLSRYFKVSTLVMLRRFHDIGAIAADQLWEAYRDELAEVATKRQKASGGGDYYRTLATSVGKRFARALVASTLEGHTLHREAMRLFGISKLSTFQNFASKLGVG